MASELNFNDDTTINNFSPFFRDKILNRNINNLEYFRERSLNTFFNYSDIGSINSIDKVGNNNSDIIKTSLKEEANKERPKNLKNNLDNSIYFNNLGFKDFNDLNVKIGSEYSINKVGNNNDIDLLSIYESLDARYFENTSKNRFQSTSDNINNRYNVNNKTYSYSDNILQREYYQNGNSPSVNYSNEEIREILSRRNVYENFESRSYDVNSQINLTPNQQFNYKEYYDEATEQLNPLNPISRFPLIQGLIANNPNDKLGKIGREELQRHATQRALTALSNKTNSLSEISLSRIVGMSNGNFGLNNEPITVPGDSLSLTRIIDYGARMLGAVNPLRVLPNSINIDGLSSKERSDKLLSRTSFQSRSFISNTLNNNKFQPDYDYKNDRIGNLTNKLGVFGSKFNTLNPDASNLYGFTKLNVNNRSNEISTDIISKDEKEFKALDSKLNNNITWDSNIPFTVIDDKFDINKNGNDSILDIKSPTKSFLLAKTRKLFKDGYIDTLIDRTSFKSNINNEIETPATNGQVSKGSGVLNNGEFCRVFSKIGKKYNSVSSLQKNKGLTSLNYNDKYTSINQNQSSVLGENGFVRIAPNSNADKLDGLKKYMFSIENLAWAGYANPSNLPESEIGNGDENGVKGRIMWFPPYISTINDNSNANWNANDFIGRGESVYTYINSNRSMNLAFKIVVDHPDYLNDDRYKILTQDDYSAFLAGCIDNLDDLNLNSDNNDDNNETIIKEIKTTSPKRIKRIKVFFPNNSSDIDNLIKIKNYENLGESIIGIGSYNDDNNEQQNDTKNFNLNKLFFDNFINGDLLTEYSDEKTQKINITLIANTTILGGRGINEPLVKKRADNVKTFLTNLANQKGVNIEIKDNFTTNINNPISDNISNRTDKLGRYVEIILSLETNINDIILNSSITEKDIADKVVSNFNEINKNQFYDESRYFEELNNSEEGNLVKKEIKDRIKNFHPAFHAITPQGFNHRLTFLHQCTRQGPTIDNSDKNNRADNLVFGKPPVCILRVGDFYHTKCIIESVNIDYEPLVWDLNPEGIGVQPMIANVSLSIKLIGGSGLRGAISRLQNAVTFNFFGNTQVFDSRSDYLDDSLQIQRGQALKRDKRK